MDKADEPLIKSYVYHKDRCFYVSTIDRDSSACADPGRYSETLVWDWDMEKRESKSLMYQRDACRGSIRQHLEVCKELFEKGDLAPEEYTH